MDDPMEAFRARFIARCREELPLLRAGPGGAEFHTVVHQLSGLAGTLGFPDVTDLARRLDTQLTDRRGADPGDLAALIRRLEALTA